jgi:simple sugar transport system ATP-binding protein
MRAADEITVLRDGRNVGTVAADETTREDLANLMVGREVLLDIEKSQTETGETILSVDDLVVNDDRGVRAVDDVSFDVSAGEVFGLAGVDGNGQSELIDAVTGLRKPKRGGITFRGEDVTRWSRRDRIEGGMAYIPEDRQERGLVMDFDLVENALLGSQHDPTFETGGRIDWDETREHAQDIIEKYDVRPPNPDAVSESLSGGNQQKFIVGREFERDPALVVAAHPTRGVDVGSIEFIHEQLLELRRRGVAILLISSKLDEVQGLSDRLGVIYEGQIMDVVDPADTTEEELGLLMAGQRPESDDEGASVLDTDGVATGGETQ